MICIARFDSIIFHPFSVCLPHHHQGGCGTDYVLSPIIFYAVAFVKNTSTTRLWPLAVVELVTCLTGQHGTSIMTELKIDSRRTRSQD